MWAFAIVDDEAPSMAYYCNYRIQLLYHAVMNIAVFERAVALLLHAAKFRVCL
jgi:hypothetical protein